MKKKINYRKELVTENKERVSVGTYDDETDIYIRLIDNDRECAIVPLTLNEAQRVKEYLEEAITTNIMNWEELK